MAVPTLLLVSGDGRGGKLRGYKQRLVYKQPGAKAEGKKMGFKFEAKTKPVLNGPSVATCSQAEQESCWRKRITTHMVC